MAWARPRNGVTEDRHTKIDGWLSWELLWGRRRRCYYPLRSALLVGILEGGCSNQVAGVGEFIAGDKSFTDAGVHGAKRGARLVCKATEIRFDEVFLEAFARI